MEVHQYFTFYFKGFIMDKTIKKSSAGALFKGNEGYLTLGLQRVNVKMVKATEQQMAKPNSPTFRLVQIDKNNPEFRKDLCGLFLKQTNGGTNFYEGSLEIGFGVMQITIWKIAEEKRKSDTSPTMAIFGKLMLERLDKNTDNNSATNSNQDIPEVEISDDEIPF